MVAVVFFFGWFVSRGPTRLDVISNTNVSTQCLHQRRQGRAAAAHLATATVQEFELEGHRPQHLALAGSGRLLLSLMLADAEEKGGFTDDTYLE